jgi:hypothetical protein
MQHSPTAVLRPTYLIVPEPEPTSVRRREKKKALEIPSGVHALVLVQWVAGPSWPQDGHDYIVCQP